MNTRRNWLRIIPLLVFAAVAATGWWARDFQTDRAVGTGARAPAVRDAGLPAEAESTLRLIQRGGPFPYDRDGSIFQNREQRLPVEPRGFYREYTVPTPGSRDRGARRIVTGGEPPRVFYYTEDHYRTFRRIEVPQ
jgi:guanyl-specific ribonuclease Sa